MFFHTIDQLVNGGQGERKSFHPRSLTKIIAAGVLIYLGTRVLCRLMNDNS